MKLIDGAVIDEALFYTQTYADLSLRLTPGSQSVIVDTVREVSIRVTLPKVKDSVFDFISVLLNGEPRSQTVTVVDAGDVGTTLAISVALDAANEQVLLFCDGLRWYEVAGHYA